MTHINWAIAEARLQTLLDRADFLLERADFLDGLANADYQCVMLQATDGAISFCEKPNRYKANDNWLFIDGAPSHQPISASRQAALSQRKKVLAEYTRVNNEIDKVREHLQLREPEDAGS